MCTWLWEKLTIRLKNKKELLVIEWNLKAANSTTWRNDQITKWLKYTQMNNTVSKVNEWKKRKHACKWPQAKKGAKKWLSTVEGQTKSIKVLQRMLQTNLDVPLNTLVIKVNF
jgi:hypothetical protein